MPKQFKNIVRNGRVPIVALASGRLTAADVTSIAARQNKLTVVVNESEDSNLYLSGVIGGSWWDDSGITEAEVLEALDEIPAGKKIHAHINSEGGSVQDGLGIYNAFKTRSKDITAHIDGYACSIASVIPLAAHKVISPKSAIWMIHQASSGVYGTADDGEKFTNMMKQHDTMLSEIYSEHTGKSVADCAAAMKAETWIRGSEAVAYGLADESDSEETGTKLTPMSQFLLDNYKNIPKNILNAISAPISAPIPVAGNNNNNIQVMNKEQMVALLKTWGVTITGTETDAQLVALVTAGKSVTAPVNNDPAPATVTAAEFRAEKRRRIRAEVIRLGENRVPNDSIETWVDRAMSAEKEETIFAEISALNVADIGGEPIGYNHIISVGIKPVLAGYQGRPTPMIENIFKEHKTPGARYDAMKENWESVRDEAIAKDRKLGVRNENTFNAGITTNFLIMGAITKLGPKCCTLKAFSRDNSVDPYKPLATGVQKYNVSVQDGSDVQTNATDFTASSDSTLNGPTIAVNQYTVGMHLTNAQLNSGVRMADLIEAKLGSFLSKIVQVVTAPITVANFSTLAPLPINAAAFSFSDAATLQGQLQRSSIKNLILAGPYIARLANTPGFFQQTGLVGGMEGAWKAFGWDLIGLNTEWQGADPYVQGFACNPQAIGTIAGLPLNPVEGIPGNIIQVGTAVLPGVDVAIATYLWMDANARTMRATYDIMLGATAVDTTAGVIIKSQ